MILFYSRSLFFIRQSFMPFLIKYQYIFEQNLENCCFFEGQSAQASSIQIQTMTFVSTSTHLSDILDQALILLSLQLYTKIYIYMRTEETLYEINSGDQLPPSSKRADGSTKIITNARKYYPFYLALSSLAFLIFLTVMYFTRGYEANSFFQYQNFDFFSFCPAIYAMKNISSRLSDMAFNEYIFKYQSQLQNLYIITAKSGQQIYNQTNDSTGNKTRLRVRYCGYARRPNQTCQHHGRFLCSNPGPYFDVQQNQQITVVWVNSYEKRTSESIDLVQTWSVNRCFSKHPKQLCNKTGKSPGFEKLILFDPIEKIPQGLNCTYSLQQKQLGLIQVETSRDSFPLSPHIHGLEVQPFYDGNPLSWFDSNGQIGVGYYPTKADQQAYLTDEYFQKLINQMGIKKKSMKINIYKNAQHPGVLWYHDHSMAVTGLNVRLGLHSFYIIRNKEIEKDLPSGEFEKMILMFSGMDDERSISSCRMQCFEQKQNSQLCNQCLIENEVKQKTFDNALMFNATYRIRILNGDYRTRFQQIRFLFQNCTDQKGNQSCIQVIPFSVIGTDSILKRYPIHNLKSISLSPAERVDILITINPNIKILNSDSQLHVVCNSFTVPNMVQENEQGYKKLAQYNLTSKQKGKILKINQINVPFFDLGQIPDQQISIKRMRPLISSSDLSFGINNHVRFKQGLSQNPKIGTVQDWYIINTISDGHPIHIHLVQFQVMEVVALKTFQIQKNKGNQTCTYYQMDTIKIQAEKNIKKGIEVDHTLLSMSSNFQNLSGLCDYTLNKMRDHLTTKLFGSLKDEQSIDENRISGLDVLARCTSRQECLFYGESVDSENQHKYIDKNVDTSYYLQDYMKGWKQSFWVPQYTYAKLRIRWTSTDFPAEKMKPLDPGNNKQGCEHGYFHIPQQNMTQYPGYVYHCHILSHQDRQMMRSIMLQPSGCRNLQPWKQRWQQNFCQFSKIKSRQMENPDG